MLTIRNAQLAALARQRTTDFAADLAVLCHRRLQARGIRADDAAVLGLIDFCIARCRSLGIVKHGRIAEFVEAMLAGGELPTTPEAMEERAASVAAELEAADRFFRLQALYRAVPDLRPPDDGSPFPRAVIRDSQPRPIKDLEAEDDRLR